MKSSNILKFLTVTLFMVFAFCIGNDIVKGNGKAKQESCMAFMLGAPVIMTGFSKKNLRTNKDFYSSTRVANGFTLLFVALQQTTAPGSAGNITSTNPNILDKTPNSSTPALGARGNVAINIKKVIPEVTLGALLTYTLTAGTTYAGGVIPLVPQLTSDTLPTGVTFSNSNYPSFAAFVAYLSKISVTLGDVQVTTDQQSNFDQILTLTYTNADGSATPRNLSWNDIGIQPINQNQNVRNYYQTGFITGSPAVRYEVKMTVPGSGTTYIRLAWNINGVGDALDFRRY